MRVSLFWRPALISLILVFAILVAVQWVSPEAVEKDWIVVVICLFVAAVAFYLTARSATSRPLRASRRR